MFFKINIKLILLCVCSFESFADCTATIRLPLSMRGTQNQLMWSGDTGGNGYGITLTNCSQANTYQYDFRYNILDTEATCTNIGSGRNYSVPLTSSSANIQSGPLQKLNSIVSGGRKYDVWAGLYKSPATSVPVEGSMEGGYSTKTIVDISTLPAGSYRCSVKNTHGAYLTNSNNSVYGAQSVFAYANNRSGWATGQVDVIINSSCSIPGSLSIDHGTVTAGKQNAKQQSINVVCNRDNNIKVILKANKDLVNGVEVNLNGSNNSKSVLNTSADGVSFGKETTLIVKSNIAGKIYFRSTLHALGEGQQRGSAYAQITYD
ncbi:hypothetical protein EW445_18005 [Salmonella enterica subsp. enterica serovar Newport]|nr:hypothetical protein [Salmonella enterica subsp. enterica serovar Newport]